VPDSQVGISQKGCTSMDKTGKMKVTYDPSKVTVEEIAKCSKKKGWRKIEIT
jgi:hypothetical protein